MWDKNDKGEDIDFHSPLPIVPREEWGAEPPKAAPEPLNYPVRNVRLTDTGTEPCWTMEQCHAILKDIQRDHMEKMGLPDIQYNFIVGGDKATVFEGRGWLGDAWRPEEHDKIKGNCIDIAYIGKYKEGSLHFRQEASGMKIIKQGQEKQYIISRPLPNIIQLPEEDDVITLET